MAGRKLNILFVVLVAVFLLGGMGGRFALSLGGNAPQLQWNFFEGRPYVELQKPSVESLSDGSFQSTADSWIAERVPARSRVLLANAGLQRACIRVANLPFGYGAYPTYFGSAYVDCPHVDAVYQAPLTREAYDDAWLGRVGEWCSRLADAAPGARCMYVLPEASNVAAAVPASQLVSCHASYGYFAEGLRAALPDSWKVPDLSHADLASYQQDYFRTDHHWQVQGALQAYCEIAGMTSPGGADGAGAADAFTEGFGEPLQVTSERFYGSSCRVGLCPDASDAFFDVTLPDASLEVVADGRPVDAAELGGVEARAGWTKDGNQFADMYDSWFHNNYQTLEVTNRDLPDDAGTIVVVGDSYSNTLTRMLARTFKRVYDVDPREYPGDVTAYIAGKNPDYLTVVMCPESVSASL